jgi:hypothetical protein
MADLMGGECAPNDRWIVHTGPFREGEFGLEFIDPESLDQDGSIFTLPAPADIEGALSIPVYDVAPWDDFSDPSLSSRNNLEAFRKNPDGSRAPSENHNPRYRMGGITPAMVLSHWAIGHVCDRELG